MKSPFQYGTLVDKESFVNRVEERKQLKELLGSGINVMLISPRRCTMGKYVRKISKRNIILEQFIAEM